VHHVVAGQDIGGRHLVVVDEDAGAEDRDTDVLEAALASPETTWNVSTFISSSMFSGSSRNFNAP
jgi:hypothetical protein